MPRTFTEEQKKQVSERIKASWAERKKSSAASKQDTPSAATLSTRQESSNRLHKMLEDNKLQEGEVGPQPPTPPLDPHPVREDMRGGAISAEERQLGVAPDRKPAQRPNLDFVRGRDEPQPGKEILVAPRIEDKLIMEIPDWNTIEIEEGESWLRMFGEMAESARSILNRRKGENIQSVPCLVCGRQVPDGKQRFSRTSLDKSTGLYTRTVICSSQCYERYRLGPQMPKPAGPQIATGR